LRTAKQTPYVLDYVRYVLQAIGYLFYLFVMRLIVYLKFWPSVSQDQDFLFEAKAKDNSSGEQRNRSAVYNCTHDNRKRTSADAAVLLNFTAHE